MSMIDQILPQRGRLKSCMLDTWEQQEQTNPSLISTRSLTTLTTINPLTPTLGKAWTYADDSKEDNIMFCGSVSCQCIGEDLQ